MSKETPDAIALYTKADDLERRAKVWAELVAEQLLDTELYGPECATKTARTQWQPLRTEADRLYRRAREAREAATGADS